MDKFTNLIEDNQLPDMGKKWKPLIPVKRDKYLTPEKLKLCVLNSEYIRKVCKLYGENDENKELEIKKTIKTILEEIGFKRNMTIIRFLGITLNKILQQMTSGLFVNRPAILNVKQDLSNGCNPILYLPSHRSYADFVLMSYMCFVHDLEIPAIAAGMDFHGMVGMGTMLRNTGAFFMRRSFSGDKMYWEVFKEYVRTLIIDYHSGMEFFIEGTRSRSCKALTPKIGLFSMALEPFLTRKVFDITIVPVGVSYDKPVEEQLFAYELLGVPKPKESTKGLLTAFETVESNHGKMFVNFGKTMSLVDYFNNDRSIYCLSGYENDVILTKERLRTISQLAHRVVDEQQKLIVLTTFNLISVYFNYRSQINEKIDLFQLKQGLIRLASFLKSLNALVSFETVKDIEKDITNSLVIHSNVLKLTQDADDKHIKLVIGKVVANKNCDLNKLKGHNLSPHTMRNAIPATLLQIYANPCLYWLHQPAFYILSTRIASSEEEISDQVKRLKRIFETEFVVSKNDEEANLRKSVEIYKNLNICQNIELSGLLLSSIMPFVFCYLNVTEILLSKLATKTFTEKELFVAVQMHVESRLNNSMPFIHPYCLSLDSIGNALYSFVINNWVQKIAATKTEPIIRFLIIQTELDKVLHQLRQYASVLREFNGLSNYITLSKL